MEPHRCNVVIDPLGAAIYSMMWPIDREIVQIPSNCRVAFIKQHILKRKLWVVAGEQVNEGVEANNLRCILTGTLSGKEL